jgi:hypothetical protein
VISPRANVASQGLNKDHSAFFPSFSMMRQWSVAGSGLGGVIAGVFLSGAIGGDGSKHQDSQYLHCCDNPICEIGLPIPVPR